MSGQGDYLTSVTKEKAQGEKSSNICTVGKILVKNTSEVWLITMDVWLSQLTVTFSWWLISYKNYNCPTCSGCMLCLMTSFGLQILSEWFSKEYADEPGRVVQNYILKIISGFSNPDLKLFYQLTEWTNALLSDEYHHQIKLKSEAWILSFSIIK